jgi:hypothetical protein
VAIIKVMPNRGMRERFEMSFQMAIERRQADPADEEGD